MTTQNGKPNDKTPDVDKLSQDEFLTPFGLLTSSAKQANCDHEWSWDGQTMTAVRWTCSKCGKTVLHGMMD